MHLWGLVGSDAERKALVVLAERVPGVTKVVDETITPLWSDAERSPVTVRSAKLRLPCHSSRATSPIVHAKT